MKSCRIARRNDEDARGSLIDFLIVSAYLFVGFVVLPLVTLYLFDPSRRPRPTLSIGAVGRTRLLWICGLLVIASLPWYLPPRHSQVKRVADRLAARAGCPRPSPQVYSDSADGLSATQRCGVIWAAMKALPPAGLAYVDAHASELQHVMILSLSDVVAFRRRGGTYLRMQPMESWLDRQPMPSAWVVVVTIGAQEYDGVFQIWVDKRSGVARRLVVGSSH